MAGHPFLAPSTPHELAHQGGGKEGVENTWPAFERAIELGYRYIETDAQVTADGVLLAFHDDTLDRMTDLRGKVADRTWDELSEIRTRVGDHPLVRLDELLERWPDVRFNIDVKNGAALEPVLELVERLDRWDTVCLASFDDFRVRSVRKAGGDRACTNVGRIAAAVIRLVSLLPVKPPVLFGGDVAQVPVKQWFVPVADRRFIAACHRAGLPVHVWTVDDADEMERLLDLGADGIITDRPSVLREVLDRRGS